MPTFECEADHEGSSSVTTGRDEDQAGGDEIQEFLKRIYNTPVPEGPPIYTQDRDHAHRLARSDPDAALSVARGISVPWYRAQALAAVARWIDDQRVEPIASESLAVAESCDDDYKRSAVAAWPIRALVERGHEALALDALKTARMVALAAVPPASQACAILLLLQGGWDLGAETRRELVEDLATIHREDTFWRIGRALVDALEMVSKTDKAFAVEIAERIVDDRCRRKALVAIHADRALAPRDFFW